MKVIDGSRQCHDSVPRHAKLRPRRVRGLCIRGACSRARIAIRVRYELESPFLDRELFVVEADEKSDAREARSDDVSETGFEEELAYQDQEDRS